MFVKQAMLSDIPQFEEEIRKLVAKYDADNGYAKPDQDVCVALARGIAASKDSGCVLFLLDKEYNLKGYLLGMSAKNLFNGSRMAVQIGQYVQKGAGGHAWKLHDEFEAWARAANCAQIHLHVSIPFDADRWDTVMARKGYQPVERVYVKEV